MEKKENLNNDFIFERSEILSKINDLKAKFEVLLLNNNNKNLKILIEAGLNLLNKTGKYIPEDYYAPERVYINNSNIKNIRKGIKDSFIVKIYDERIKDTIPRFIQIEGKKYKLEVIVSKSY